MSRLYRVRHGDGGQGQFASNDSDQIAGRVDLFVGAIAYAGRWLKIGLKQQGKCPSKNRSI